MRCWLMVASVDLLSSPLINRSYYSSDGALDERVSQADLMLTGCCTVNGWR
jgi:hypothetical protein